MQLFRYASSIYGGGDVLIGANYGLLVWFAAAGAVANVIHAVYMAVAGTSH